MLIWNQMRISKGLKRSSKLGEEKRTERNAADIDIDNDVEDKLYSPRNILR